MLADTLREWEERLVDESRRAGRREGLQEGRQGGRRQGRREVLAEERALLCGLAERRFGAKTSQALAGILVGVEDNAQLMRVATLIGECATGSDLFARVQPR